MDRAQTSRSLRLFLLLLAFAWVAVFALGCGDDEAPATTKKEAEAAEQPMTPEQRVQKYYADQRKGKRPRKEANPENAIVQCRIDGGTRMTRCFDCLSMGGREL